MKEWASSSLHDSFSDPLMVLKDVRMIYLCLKEGGTAVRFAAEYDKEDTLKLLIADGADLDAEDKVRLL